MHRTQVSLENHQLARLRELAEAEGKSIAALIRGLVEAYIERHPKPNEDPLARLKGIVEGDGQAGGRDHDRYLYGNQRE